MSLTVYIHMNDPIAMSLTVYIHMNNLRYASYTHQAFKAI